MIAVPPGFAGVKGGQLDELDARLGGGVVAWLGAKKFEPKAGDALVIATYGRIGAPQVALVGTGGRTATELRKANRAGWSARPGAQGGPRGGGPRRARRGGDRRGH